MANTVIALKKSSVPTAQPTVLANGELAINYADGKLFYKHANGTILPFNTQGGNAFGTINANGTLVVAGSSEAVVSIIAGNNISIVGDAINDRITISATGGGDSTISSLAFDKANSANVLAFNTGIGANAFTSSTIAGANTAVGAGANAYAASIANTIAIAAFNKANDANIVASSAFDKANSANVLAFNTGIGANAFTSATIAGANTAVGTGANTWANTKVSSVTGTAGQIFSSGGTTPTINLISSGAATGTYGNSTLIPVITVDSFGRITSASNIAASGGGSAVTVTTAQLKDLTTENTVVTNVSTFTGAVVDSTIAIAAFDKANTGGSGSLTTYSANVGDGAANTYNVSHNLNSYSLLMTMREIATGYIIYPDLQQTTSNNLVISFVDNPTANQYALLIAKVT